MSNEFISHTELVSASQVTIKDPETSLSADRQVHGDEGYIIKAHLAMRFVENRWD